MAQVKIQTDELGSLSPVISLQKNLERDVIEPLSAISYESLVTRNQLESYSSGDVQPIVRELTIGQSIPLAVSLPANFNGKYQVNVKIERSGGIWENYPNALIQDLLDTSNLPDYFVNRVDIYGSPDGNGANLDHLLFTFTKA